ncbi:hypothetical protein [Rhodococcus jostii]|uniref:Antitoxin Xre/MbcA/ParS-like toxin-binding domain-containing protein n=1 Tax=Rhodococcus jostii TaxID=132919 RepID=A0A1H5FGS9_RHOJO|nr:hypothetical protein [Rhodococcus jostii]SEE02586.1 hypothetical protein SAMN04490220_6394 [Rhodococcus jostii]
MSIDHDLGAELRALPDGEFFALLAREVANRESMSSVRDALLSLVASGPTLSASIASAVPAHAVTESIARARIETTARQAIFEHPHLEASDVADVLRSRDSNRRSPASRLRERGDIVGYEIGGRYLYPSFQFDSATAKVRPVVAEINQLLNAKHDPWGVSSWWISPSGWLQGGQSPADLAAEGGQDDRIRDIAHDLMAD